MSRRGAEGVGENPNPDARSDTAGSGCVGFSSLCRATAPAHTVGMGGPGAKRETEDPGPLGSWRETPTQPLPRAREREFGCDRRLWRTAWALANSIWKAGAAWLS